MPFSKTKVSPSVRSARGAEKRVLSGFTTRSESMKPSRKSSVRLNLSPVMTVPLDSVIRALPMAVTRLLPWS